MADFITTKANGDSLDASEWNQLEEIDNAIDSSGLTLNTAKKDQLKISMARYASGANFYTDGGSANAYVLTSISHGGGKSFAPAGAGAVNYFNGMSVRFRPANNNSGASTVNVSGFGSKDIRKSNGTSALTGGELTTATDVILRYDSTNSCFIIQEYAKATTTTQGVQYLKSNKNAIINGDFNIWQRGGTFTSVGAGVYTSDRWQYGKNGAMVHDITLSSDVPTVAQAGRLIRYSLKIDCQTVDASIASSEYAMLSQNIEGYNFIPLAQKTMTLSFWVKATKTGIYSVSFRNGGPDRSYVAEYTVNVSNTWEFKTLTILPSPASGSWDYTNSRGLSVDFTLAVGSTFQTTKDAWQTGNFLGTSNQVNACDSTSNDFLITSVQLEEGDVATPFENRTFADELRLCQRYYEKTYNQSAVAGALTFIGSRAFSSQNGQQNLCPVYFKVTKRANPTITLFSPITGVAGKISTGVIDIDGTAYNPAEDGFYVGPTTTTTLTNLFFP